MYAFHCVGSFPRVKNVCKTGVQLVHTFYVRRISSSSRLMLHHFNNKCKTQNRKFKNTLPLIMMIEKAAMPARAISPPAMINERKTTMLHPAIRAFPA